MDKYKNFKWLGALQYPDQVRQYIASIDVYALPSGIDMSPLTLQEAQLMKKPVIATAVGGIPELMKDGETGFLIEKDDSWSRFLDDRCNSFSTYVLKYQIIWRRYLSKN